VGCTLTAALLLALPADGAAQFFLASRPSPDFAIGPLLVRATVGPGLGPVTVDVLWSLVIPPTRSALGVEQDLYLLWPGRVVAGRGDADPALARYVEARGFTVVAEGRLPLFAQNLYAPTDDQGPAPIAPGAPFVTFVRQGLRPLGLTSAATYIRIPWTRTLANRTWLVKLPLTVSGLVKREEAGWLQNTLWGPRHLLSIGFNDVREQTLFAMYLEFRDRVVALGNEPSQLIVNFIAADRLRIDDVFPPSSQRQRSEFQATTESVSLFLEPSEGRAPQVLTIRFAYFSGLQTWAPILVPILFFVLGRATGPLIERVARRIGGRLANRVHLGRASVPPRPSDDGVILTREALARIIPGQTTFEDVVALCGRQVEEQEQLVSPLRRTLIYRGRRVVPRRRPLLAWLSTVSHWDIEHHEVEITFERDLVRDVQLRVRRAQLARPEAPP
jgi:hypothetical protein